MQGPELFMLNNEVSMKLFSDKSYGIELFSLSAASISLVTQFGKASKSRIISQEWSYNNSISELQLSEWFGTDDINNLEFDALDKDDNIPNEYESDIIVNVYGDNPDNEETMQALKNRYNKFKQTFGINLKVFGFSFYSYPTAISYEWHMPYKDITNNQGRHYLKVLFDF